MKRSKVLHSVIQMFLDPSGTRRVTDLGTVAQARLLHGLVLLDVVQPQGFDAIRHLIRSLRAPDDDAYLKAFDALDDALIEALRTSQGLSVFLDHLKSKTPTWLHAIVDAITSSGGCDGRLTVKRLRQCNFILRVNREGAEKPYDKFLEVNKTRDHTPSTRLRDLGRELVNDPRFIAGFMTNFRPGHGPGSTAFAAKGKFKTRAGSAVDKDPKVDTNRLRHYVVRTPFEGVFDHYPDTSARDEAPSIIRAVPKSWKKMRLIAIEDTTRMYLQQGVFHSLKGALHASALTKDHIDLSRAYLNADEARKGSFLRNVDTIDLSSASDSVGYEFVQELFGDTWIWTTLDVCSTRRFQVEEDLVESKIFATMGNAVCFPVMTMILSLVCREAEEACHVPSSHRCYGDDITIDSKATETLVGKLDEYGFKVNTDKSFVGRSPFRESCGGEYVDGIDVTPIRISRKFSTLALESAQDFEEIESLRDLYNRLYRDFPMARDLVADVITDGYTRHFPRTEDGKIGLLCDNTQALRLWREQRFAEMRPEVAPDGRTRTGWDPDLQRSFVECDNVTREMKKRKRRGDFALAEWLVRRAADHRKVDLLADKTEFFSPFLGGEAESVLDEALEYANDIAQQCADRIRTPSTSPDGWEPLETSTATSSGAVHLDKCRFYYGSPRFTRSVPHKG